MIDKNESAEAFALPEEETCALPISWEGVFIYD